MLSSFKVLFLAFFDICRLKKGPQDIPESKNLLFLGLVSYGAISIVLAALTQDVDKAILSGLIEVALIMLFTQALLQICGKVPRWTQTVTALCGTGIIISLIALPLYLVIGVGGNNDGSDVQVFGLVLSASLACWNIIIMAHILRHALEVHMGFSIILSLIYIWIIFSFTTAIIPIETAS